MSDDHRICGLAQRHINRLRAGDGDPERGEMVLRAEAVARRRESAPGSLALAEELVWLGKASRGLDEAQRARAVREAYRLFASLPRTTEWLRGYALGALVRELAAVGDKSEARRLAQWQVELCETRTLASADDAMWQRQAHAFALRELAELTKGAAAERALRRRLDVERNSARSTGYLGVAMALRDLAECCERNGKLDEAASLLREAVAEARRQFEEGETAWFVAEYLEPQARVLRRLGSAREARAAADEAIARYERMAAWAAKEGNREVEERFRGFAQRVRDAG